MADHVRVDDVQPEGEQELGILALQQLLGRRRDVPATNAAARTVPREEHEMRSARPSRETERDSD